MPKHYPEAFDAVIQWSGKSQFPNTDPHPECTAEGYPLIYGEIKHPTLPVGTNEPPEDQADHLPFSDAFNNNNDGKWDEADPGNNIDGGGYLQNTYQTFPQTGMYGAARWHHQTIPWAVDAYPDEGTIWRLEADLIPLETKPFAWRTSEIYLVLASYRSTGTAALGLHGYTFRVQSDYWADTVFPNPLPSDVPENAIIELFGPPSAGPGLGSAVLPTSSHITSIQRMKLEVEVLVRNPLETQFEIRGYLDDVLVVTVLHGIAYEFPTVHLATGIQGFGNPTNRIGQMYGTTFDNWNVAIENPNFVPPGSGSGAFGAGFGDDFE